MRVFLFPAESPGAYTRSASLKKALMLSLRAEYTTFRDPGKYTEHERNATTVADLVVLYIRESGSVCLLLCTIAQPDINA